MLTQCRQHIVAATICPGCGVHFCLLVRPCRNLICRGFCQTGILCLDVPAQTHPLPRVHPYPSPSLPRPPYPPCPLPSLPIPSSSSPWDPRPHKTRRTPGPCVQHRVWTRQQVGSSDCWVESSETGGLVWSRPRGTAPLSSWLLGEAQDGPGVAEPQRLADPAGSLHRPAFLTDTPTLLCFSLQEKWNLSTCWPARPPTGTSAVSR